MNDGDEAGRPALIVRRLIALRPLWRHLDRSAHASRAAHRGLERRGLCVRKRATPCAAASALDSATRWDGHFGPRASGSLLDAVIQRQLGHANLGITSISSEIIYIVHRRPAPMLPASAGLH
jgi:hypothetical protein